nr:unnamed protein product [Digitaria exilis]
MEPPPPPATPSASVRVLSRTTPPPASPSPSSAPSHDGVVAVGFVGAAGAARLADRILDAHVFSPGGSAGSLAGSVRYHRDADRRMVFLHLTPPPAPMEAGGTGGPELPEMLFMFSDDAIDGSSAAASLDDTGDTFSSNQVSASDGLSKQSSTSKGSGSVVMLARAGNKSESSPGKKLHSSLEGQIRVLLKKCRLLAGMEPGHIGPRGASNMSHHVPLFSLDTSRIVALLERSMNKKREPLDFIAGLFEDSLSSKSPLDVLSLENNYHPANHDDFQLIKDFIFRQSDALRGKGGYSSNPTAGSVAGVGMVAAAAAAAAVSAAAGKPVNAPDLPSFDKWLSISTSILTALLTGRSELSCLSENKTHTNPSEKNDQLPAGGSNAVDITLSCLESSNGLNMKFSSSWCQRVLPAAKEMYLKGPAVRVFSKKLEDECRTIWESGRQQCDAVLMMQVTPDFPVLLASCPLVQFEASMQ